MGVHANGEDKIIALVNDNSRFLDTRSRLLESQILGISVETFISCENLLKEIKAGVKFDIFILDLDMGDNQMQGDACALEIRSIDPNAKIIGTSSYESYGSYFKDINVQFIELSDFGDLVIAIQKLLR